MGTGPYKVESCVQCQYLFEGLEADGNCPECGLPIKTSVVSASFPLAYLKLRQQKLYWASVIGIPISWIAFNFMVNPPGFMTHDLYRSVTSIWFFTIPALLITTGMFVWRCWQLRYISEHVLLRPANALVYIVLLCLSLLTSAVFMAALVSNP